MIPENDELVVLIVDDEKQAGINLQSLLHEYVDPNIRVAGIANSTQEAEIKIAKYNPDAVFFDIEMPRENAFQFLARIAPVNFDVIFVTAYNTYAVNAFRLNAIDYILKPISVLELRNAVERLRKSRKVRNIMAQGSQPFATLPALVSGATKPTTITLRGTNGLEVVSFRDIYYIEAQSSYSRFVFESDGKPKELVMSYPLSNYEASLPADMFFRIHRSYLVSRLHIKNTTADLSFVTLNGNFKLPVSRRKHSILADLLK